MIGVFLESQIDDVQTYICAFVAQTIVRSQVSKVIVIATFCFVHFYILEMTVLVIKTFKRPRRSYSHVFPLYSNKQQQRKITNFQAAEPPEFQTTPVWFHLKRDNLRRRPTSPEDTRSLILPLITECIHFYSFLPQFGLVYDSFVRSFSQLRRFRVRNESFQTIYRQ